MALSWHRSLPMSPHLEGDAHRGGIKDELKRYIPAPAGDFPQHADSHLLLWRSMAHCELYFLLKFKPRCVQGQCGMAPD